MNEVELIFGSMRLHERPRDHTAIVELLESLADLGVRRLHSSYDYESFRLLTSVLCDAQIDVAHLVKCPCPDFGDHDTTWALGARVDAYRRALGCEQVDVQWCARREAQVEAIAFQQLAVRARSDLDALHESGAVGSVCAFAYDQRELDALAQAGFTAFTLYRGPDDEWLEPPPGTSVCALRPLGAGQHNGGAVDDRMSELRHDPRVAQAICSWSSKAHGRQLRDLTR